MSSILRYALFASMVASIVGLYTSVVGPSLGKLKLESTSMLLVISAVLAVPVYNALCRDGRLPVQVLTLYCGFVLTCLVYGVFMWSVGADGTPVFLFTALVAGHILGMPLFLILLLLHLVLERLGFYRATGDTARS